MLEGVNGKGGFMIFTTLSDTTPWRSEEAHDAQRLLDIGGDWLGPLDGPLCALPQHVHEVVGPS